MNEPLSTEPYKGVRDFYPADWARFEAILERQRRMLRSWGYEEYQASPLESAELYEKKTSEEIVSEQTYTFEDRGGRRVTLRPEMTPTLARMVAGKRRELSFPLRWFSIGNRFRYERPQKGRTREFYQCDVDLLGLPEGEADVEVVMLADQMLKAFGAHGNEYVIRINSRSLLTKACDAAGLTDDQVKGYLRLLDKKDKMPAADFSEKLREITDTDPLMLIENDDARITGEKEAVTGLVATLQERGVSGATFDPTVTRGFDYYTGLTFEVFDVNPENQRAILGGGRYDRLLALFGGEAIPAVGFAVGTTTLSDFLETHGLLPDASAAPQVYLGTPLPADRELAAKFAQSLRAEGLRVFVNLTEKNLGDQVRDAVRRAIPYFLPYGAEEESSGRVRLKALVTGEENDVPSTDVAEFVAGS
ncbi:MAG TPA: histidine--tRNA ligase [Candidatus Paceibacterota bacterium]|nr:histidine--tRNA ligase [Candidatus Paceibacterota bacterium]